MKISFVAIRPKHSSYGLFSIAPLGLVYLSTILKKKGYDVTIFDEARIKIYNEKKDKLHDEILKSDFVGISVISPAANRSLKFVKSLRRHQPNVRIAVGGPHILGQEQAEQFSKYADVVVQKEAENIIEEVVDGRSQGIIKGEKVTNLDELPIPDLNLIRNYNGKLTDFFKLTPISSARGCPRNCEFCTVSNIHGKRVRQRSSELVIMELKQRLIEDYKRIFFVDDNFSVLPGKRIPLLEEMSKLNSKGSWFESIIIQDEVPGILRGGDSYVKLLKSAGIKTVMLGVESFDDKKLNAMHKHHKTSDSEKAIRLLKKHGLIIYAFGMAKPEIDDKNSIRRQFRKLRKEGIDYADMTIETPVPGTTYWNKYKDKLTATINGYPDWDKWTFLTPVIPVKHMSQKEFQKEVKKNMQRFYSPFRAFKNILQGKIRRGLTIFYVWTTTGKMYV